MSILRKVKLLEEYVAADASAIDPAVELAIEKLLKREVSRMDELKQRLLRQKADFEKKYAMRTKFSWMRPFGSCHWQRASPDILAVPEV